VRGAILLSSRILEQNVYSQEKEIVLWHASACCYAEEYLGLRELRRQSDEFLNGSIHSQDLHSQTEEQPVAKLSAKLNPEKNKSRLWRWQTTVIVEIRILKISEQVSDRNLTMIDIDKFYIFTSKDFVCDDCPTNRDHSSVRFAFIFVYLFCLFSSSED